MAAVLALLVTSGCSALERSCTTIGSLSGVSVTVDRVVAADLDGLRLRVCWPLDSADPTCRDDVVELTPGTDSIDQGCASGGPDAVCSATASPNGTLVGFLQLDDLSEGRARVSGVVTIAGRRQALPPVTVAAEPSYPNGPDCGAGGQQARVTLGSDGLR
jgi:hypothetical protein